MVRAASNPSSLATPLVHLPDGRIAPPVLTAREVCLLLRMEVPEQPQDERKDLALRALEHYRLKGLLPAVKIGHDIRFKLVDCLAFIDRQQEDVPR